MIHFKEDDDEKEVSTFREFFSKFTLAQMQLLISLLGVLVLLKKAVQKSAEIRDEKETASEKPINQAIDRG